MGETEKITVYKVLKDGQSCSGGSLSWSLPDGDTPGGWHEVTGELVQCKNGLHLGVDPRRYHHEGREIYLAEYKGNTIGPLGGELVCRKVRLLRKVGSDELAGIYADLDAAAAKRRDAEEARRAAQEAAENEENRVKAEKRRKENREWRAKKKTAEESRESPAYALLTHVWRRTAGGSWDRLNGAMSSALRLALQSGMRFNPDDFKRFSEDFNSGRWIGDGEWCYGVACGSERGDHGGNPSAVQAFEKWRGRKPFIVLRSANDTPRVRLSVGEAFDWHVGLKTQVRVKVTSFVDKPPGDKPPYVVACSYKEAESGSYERKIDKRFSITHDAIAEYHKAVRDHEKRRSEEATAKETVQS